MKTITPILLWAFFAILSTPENVKAQIADHVVISQVYGGGGNTGATYTNDFIELYNPTSSTINLSGWSVQYASATSASWSGTALTGSIVPYSYYLIQEDSNHANIGIALPTPDDAGTINLSTSVGKVALLNTTTLLMDTCSTSSSIIDFVGYGSTANCFEGTGPTPTPSSNNTKSVFRISGSNAANRGSGYDSDDNNNDFATGDVAPRNSASAAQPPTLNTDYFRSSASGDWDNINSWQSASDSTDWLNASLSPDINAAAVDILNGDTITATTDISLNKTTIQSGGTLNINPLVTLTINDGSGTDFTIASGGNCVLKSDATGSANFGDIGTATIDQSGQVTTERYLSAPSNLSGGRSWRLITAPLKGSSNNSIFYNWQNNGVNNGTGIELWSPSGTGSGGNGLATGGGAASIYKYNAATNAYVAVTNTTTEPLFDASGNKAFLAFVSGSYGSGNISSGATATNAHAAGSLITGTQDYAFTPTSASNNLQLIGNPYNCPIDFDKVYSHSTNISQKFWVIDPSLNNIGGYVVVSWNGSSYDVVPSSNQNQYIQTGQAFFVEAPTVAAANVEIQESDKETTAAQTAVFRTNGGNLETFRINLNKSIGGNFTLIDGALYNCRQNLSNTIGSEDATKFGNFNEAISILEGTTKLAIDGRQLFDNGDSIHIAMSNMQQTNYQLELQPGNINVPWLTATLYDNFLNTTTPVSLTTNTIYPFTVTSNAASYSNNRFKILFSGTNPLAIKFISVNAQKENQTVQITWTIANESGTSYYNIERSNDGKTFTSIGSVNATGKTDYEFNDATPGNGNNYYRIKAISRSNKAIYSKVVSVTMSDQQAQLSTYPNPIKDGKVQINISNIANGNYHISIYNNLGQKVAEQAVNYQGGNQQISMNIEQLAAGMYHLSLTNNEGEKITEQKLIKQ